MKLVGIVGSNAEISYNRKLMEFIAKEYKDLLLATEDNDFYEHPGFFCKGNLKRT